MIFYDTETCGFHGPIVLIQYAIDDGPISLYCPWIETIDETIDLIEDMVANPEGMVGFNLAFDHFHLQQMYTTLLVLREKVGGYEILEDHITEYALSEPEARLGPCLKPVAACDLMMVARKGEYQSTMDRKDIRITRIPTPLAQPLADVLSDRIKLKDLYFARKKDPKKRWQVDDIKDEDDEVIPDFKNVSIRFAPSSALKALAEDMFGIEKAIKFKDVNVPPEYRPVEHGYAPFALAPFKDKKGIMREPAPPHFWYGKWPQVIKYHINHWAFNEEAREYAELDVVYTRNIYYEFGSPELGDDDSELTCMVGSVRWRGYAIDLDAIIKLRNKAQETQDAQPWSFNSPKVCREYMLEVTSEHEQLAMLKDGKISTEGKILEAISKWGDESVCEECQGMGCDICGDGFMTVNEGSHPAAKRALEIIDYRKAGKNINTYQKLINAGRFHASFKVLGALSSRMSGADGLNAQGINHAKETRRCFPLADNGLVNCGGDFSGFEVTIMDAAYGDPQLRKDLMEMRPCATCSKPSPCCKDGACTHDLGNYKCFNCEQEHVCKICYKCVNCEKCNKCDGTGEEATKIHALFGQFLFPPMTYDEIKATDGAGGMADKYSRSKNGVFALAYGGEEYTLATRVGITEEAAGKSYNRWCTRYKVWGEERQRIFDQFCSMRQPDGIGKQVHWADPMDYVESMTGFRRYFTLENMICKALFNLANKPPKEWKEFKVRVKRREREQTAAGSVQSALYGAAFKIQASNMRAAGNHKIQSTGGILTKRLQVRLWDIQPCGVHEWKIVPMQIHDEIMSPCLPEVVPDQHRIKDEFLDEHRETIPLIGIDWSDSFATWADK